MQDNTGNLKTSDQSIPCEPSSGMFRQLTADAGNVLRKETVLLKDQHRPSNRPCRKRCMQYVGMLYRSEMYSGTLNVIADWQYVKKTLSKAVLKGAAGSENWVVWLSARP
jgi:hypothetical protein